MRRKSMKPPEIVLRSACNQRCVYCLAAGRRRGQSAAEIEAVLAAGHTQVSFQGGEPLFSPKLPYWVRRAREKGIEATVFTNGTLLSDDSVVEPVLSAGASCFNVNFPSHLPRLHDYLTGTSGGFRAKVAGIRKLLDSGRARVVFTFVINKFNYSSFPRYIEYVADNFPGLFYVNAYFIINNGAVLKRRELIPAVSECSPYIRAGLETAARRGLKVMVDGIPLCHLGGFEECSADTQRLVLEKHVDMYEKAKGPVCKKCGLNSICAGLRADYAKKFGFGELSPSLANPETVRRRVWQ